MFDSSCPQVVYQIQVVIIGRNELAHVVMIFIAARDGGVFSLPIILIHLLLYSYQYLLYTISEAGSFCML